MNLKQTAKAKIPMTCIAAQSSVRGLTNRERPLGRIYTEIWLQIPKIFSTEGILSVIRCMLK